MSMLKSKLTGRTQTTAASCGKNTAVKRQKCDVDLMSRCTCIYVLITAPNRGLNRHNLTEAMFPHTVSDNLWLATSSYQQLMVQIRGLFFSLALRDFNYTALVQTIWRGCSTNDRSSKIIRLHGRFWGGKAASLT